MSPSRAVLLVGGVGGLLFLLVTPPFQAPDETVHFRRAYLVSQGGLFAPPAGSGAWLPASLHEVSDPFEDFHGRPERRVLRGELAAALARPLDPGRRVSTWLGGTAVYTPVPYLPQAAGALAGRVLGLRPLVLLYLERLANLAAALLIVWAAVRLAPFAAWPLALLSLLPMAAFLRSSASADALTYAAALLAAAAVLAAGWGPPDGVRRAWALLLAGALMLALSKGVYFLLPLAGFIVPPARFGARRHAAAAFAGLLLAVSLGVGVSAWTARRSVAPLRFGIDIRPGEQAREVARHPLRFLALAGTDYVGHAPRYAIQLVGKLGWLDTALPLPLVAACALLLAGTALAGGSPEVALSAWRRLLPLALAAGTLLLISVSQYLTWTAFGAAEVEGLQGRYFLPVAPFVVPALASRRWARDLGSPRISCILFAAAALWTAVALAVVAARYYEL